MNGAIKNMDDFFLTIDVSILIDILCGKFGVDSVKLTTSSWDDLLLDDLDRIEIIMELEKRHNCFISDEIGDTIYEYSPSDIMGRLVANKRNEKLNQLGI